MAEIDVEQVKKRASNFANGRHEYYSNQVLWESLCQCIAAIEQLQVEKSDLEYFGRVIVTQWRGRPDIRSMHELKMDVDRACDDFIRCCVRQSMKGESDG